MLQLEVVDFILFDCFILFIISTTFLVTAPPRPKHTHTQKTKTTDFNQREPNSISGTKLENARGTWRTSRVLQNNASSLIAIKGSPYYPKENTKTYKHKKCLLLDGALVSDWCSSCSSFLSVSSFDRPEPLLSPSISQQKDQQIDKCKKTSTAKEKKSCYKWIHVIQAVKWGRSSNIPGPSRGHK